MPLATDTTNVLTSFRTTRREMWEWRAVSEYAFHAEQAVGLLAEMAEDYGAGALIPVVRKAIASTFTVLMRSDDSGGLIQLVIDDLLTLHAELCTEEPPAPATLVTWIIRQQFGEIGEYFEIDINDYEEALGERGLATYERHLEKKRSSLTRPFDGTPSLRFERDDEAGTRSALLRALQRLAVLRGDEAAILRTHGADLPHPHLRFGTAKALHEAGLMQPAIDIAHAGMNTEGAAYQREECGVLWRDLLIETGTDSASDAAAEVFDRWPRAGSASRLAEVAPNWSEIRESVIERLRPRAYEVVTFLLEQGDVVRAWSEAMLATEEGRTLRIDDWDDLVAAYRKVDRIAVLPVMGRMIDNLLVEARSRSYPGVVRRMQALRKAALDAGKPEIAADLLVELRSKYARRPALIQRMDAARL